MCHSIIAWGMDLYLACFTVTTNASIPKLKYALKNLQAAVT